MARFKLDLSDSEDEDDDDTVLAVGLQHKLRRLSLADDVSTAAHRAREAVLFNKFDPFQLLSEDIHQHILSFLMCVSTPVAEYPTFAVAFSMDPYVREQHIDMAVMTTPAKLVQVCETVSLVSKQWRDVAIDMMNIKAPSGIITS